MQEIVIFVKLHTVLPFYNLFSLSDFFTIPKLHGAVKNISLNYFLLNNYEGRKDLMIDI